MLSSTVKRSSPRDGIVEALMALSLGRGVLRAGDLHDVEVLRAHDVGLFEEELARAAALLDEVRAHEAGVERFVLRGDEPVHQNDGVPPLGLGEHGVPPVLHDGRKGNHVHPVGDEGADGVDLLFLFLIGVEHHQAHARGARRPPRCCACCPRARRFPIPAGKSPAARVRRWERRRFGRFHRARRRTAAPRKAAASAKLSRYFMSISSRKAREWSFAKYTIFFVTCLLTDGGKTKAPRACAGRQGGADEKRGAVRARPSGRRIFSRAG